MPVPGRITPCAECPWLRRSMAGYLGLDEPVNFYRQSVTNECLMPCHMEIDYDDPEWLETQYPDVSLCAGNLIYFRNNFKRPRRPELEAAVETVKPSKHVFSWPEEFMAHHAPYHHRDGDAKELATRASLPVDPELCCTSKSSAKPLSTRD